MASEIQPETMPFITEFYRNGVYCPRMQPVFPTKTLVNHFSIATGTILYKKNNEKTHTQLQLRFIHFPGLYAESHGVFDKRFFDFNLREEIRYSSEMYMFKANVTPIWTLNELAGQHSAVSMWSSGEFAFRNLTPTYDEPFTENVHWQPRIDRLMPLLKRNESQVNFVMFYINHPDKESHLFAVPSKKVSGYYVKDVSVAQ